MGLIAAASASIGNGPFFSSWGNFCCNERIADKIVDDHSLDSRKAITYARIMENDKLTFQDKLILDSVDTYDLSLAKQLLFNKVIDEDEVMLKKKVIFNAVHEFDHHNFHDFDHDLHLGSGLKFDDLNCNSFCENNCVNVWITHNLIKKVCE